MARKVETDLDLQSKVRIRNLPSPTADKDGVSKAYVDNWLYPITEITSAIYQVNPTDRLIIYRGLTNTTLTLPSRTVGQELIIRNATNRIVTVAGGTANINGRSSIRLDRLYASVTLIADNLEWGIY